MPRDFRIKTENGQIDIPETAGKLHIKTGASTQSEIKSLYVKTDPSATTPSLVWQAGTAGGGTNTVPTCDLCTTPLNHWPLIPNTGNRWDCTQWDATGNVIINGNATILSDTFPGGATVPYAKIYNLTNPEPPPPGYVVVDYATFIVKDSFVIFNLDLLTATGNNIQLSTKTNSGESFKGNFFPLYTSTNSAVNNAYTLFNNSHGGNSNTFYYTVCDSNYLRWPQLIPPTGYNCSLFNYDHNWFEPTGQQKVCCGGCINGVGGIQSLGQSCVSASDRISGSTQAVKDSVITEVACVGTSINYPNSCTNKCYGFPEAPASLPSNTDPINMCRTVSRLPNSMGFAVHGDGGNFDLTPNNSNNCSLSFDFYNAKLKFNEMAVIGTPKCDCSGCSGDCGNCTSAWFARIFTPFYVYLPNTKYDGTGTNLLGKYIEITIDFETNNYISSWKSPNNTSFPFNNIPILKTIKSLLSGNISSCGITMGFPYTVSDVPVDISGINPSELSSTDNSKNLIWTLNEYPVQISTNVPSHTHQVVIEYWQSQDACTGFCQSTSPNAAFTNLKIIRLYPITDTSGNMNSKLFYNFINYTVSTSAYGIKDLNSVRWYFNPNTGLNNSDLGTDGAGLFSNKINPTSLALNDAIYRVNNWQSSNNSAAKQTAYVTTFYNTGATTKNLNNDSILSAQTGIVKNILDTIQQAKV